MKRERTLRELFDIGLALKIADGMLGLLAGILVIIVPRNLIPHIADITTAGELTEDPHDLVANWIRNQAHTFSLHTHYLIAAYLILRGVTKIILAVLILRGHRFAYPLFVAALALFAFYETYRSITTVNFLLGAIALFDIALIFLTAHEYRARYSSQL